jgi:hypothetical protein
MSSKSSGFVSMRFDMSFLKSVIACSDSLVPFSWGLYRRHEVLSSFLRNSRYFSESWNDSNCSGL